MLSHGDLLGSRRFEGVRGGAVRSSERSAIVSSVGRLESDLGACAYGDEECECECDCEREWEVEVDDVRDGFLTGIAGDDEDGSEAVVELRFALRSFWRRFWNHIVTTLGSLVCAGTGRIE